MTLPRAVIFDVDGTLFDSERHGHRVAFNKAFAEAGLPHRWDEERYGELLRVSGGRQRLCAYLVDEGYAYQQAESLAASLHQRKTEIFAALCADGSIPPRAGVVRLLDQLADAGVTLAVATTGTRKWVKPLLSTGLGLDRFALVLTGTEVPNLKPEPDVYLEALRQLDVAAEDAMAVEDSANGLRAATAAGLGALVVVNDYTGDIDPTRADLVVDGYGEPDSPARVLHGPAHALDAGTISPVTFDYVHSGLKA